MRTIDPKKAFCRLAVWMAESTKDVQGLVVSLSGTDSALAYLVSAKANELNGKDRNCLVGIHYGASYPFQAWFEQYGRVEVTQLSENSIITDDDVYRWAALQNYAMDRRHWIVGTRNRMEQMLGDYSLASTVAVIQPILPLWKSEVLALCTDLGVPSDLLKAGWKGDPHCECHRPQIMRNLDACELALAYLAGEIDEAEARAHPMYDGIRDLLDRAAKPHKSILPYVPPVEIFDESVEDVSCDTP